MEHGILWRYSSAGPLLMTCQWLGIPKPLDRGQKALCVHRAAEEGLWIGSLCCKVGVLVLADMGR